MATSPPTNNRRRIVSLVVMVVLMAVSVVLMMALAIGVWVRHGVDGTTPVAPIASSSNNGGQSITPHTNLDCMSSTTPFTPAHLLLKQYGYQSTVLDLPDDNGSIPAPPEDMSHETAWFTKSALAGSSKGNVVLTEHTYHMGGALGNDLLHWKSSDGTKTLQRGSELILTDDAGHRACYAYDTSKKVRVSSKDTETNIAQLPVFTAASTDIVNFSGKPQIALVVCSDYEGNGYWATRTIFYAHLMQ